MERQQELEKDKRKKEEWKQQIERQEKIEIEMKALRLQAKKVDGDSQDDFNLLWPKT